MRSTSCAAAVTIERKAVIFLSWFLVFGSPSPHSSKWGLCWQHQLGDGGTTPGPVLHSPLRREQLWTLFPDSYLIMCWQLRMIAHLDFTTSIKIIIRIRLWIEKWITGSLNYIRLMWDWTMLGPENEKGLFYDKTWPRLLTWWHLR